MMTRAPFAAAVALVASTARAAAPLYEGDVAALATSGDRLFIGAFDRGVHEVAADGTVTPLQDPAVNPNVNALLVDRSRERLFVGTARGVAECTLVTPRRCRRVGERSGVHALVELRSGVVLAGGDDGVLAIGVDGRTASYSRKGGAPYRGVWALAEAKDGTVFVGATNGLHYATGSVFDPTGRGGKPSMRRAGMITGDLPDDWVTALSSDGETLRVGTYNSGVTSFRFDAGRLSRTATDAALGYVNPAGVTALGDGRAAVATMSGLSVGEPGFWTKVPTPAEDVTAVVPVPGTSDHWVATRRGVTRMHLGSAR